MFIVDERLRHQWPAFFINNDMMAIKAILFDLDNTLYPAASIAGELFRPLIALITGYDQEAAADPELHRLLQRKPFQDIARQYGFSEELLTKATALLRDLVWEGDIQPYPGFNTLMALPQRKFLVTAGFTKMQFSKIKTLQLDQYFEGIYIIDPEISDVGKRERFEEIRQTSGLRAAEVLVVGDDADSEIKAGLDLGMPVILFDSLGLFPDQKVARVNALTDLVKQLQT